MTQKILSLLFLVFSVFSAGAAPLKEGLQYSVMEKTVENAPVVVEFFSFYCPPCMAFSRVYKVSDAIDRVLPEGTRVEKFHVGAMGDMGQALTEAWSVAMALGVTDKIELPLFIAVQDKKSVHSEADIRQIFVDAGVPTEEYDSAKKSFVVKALTQKQIQAALQFDVRGTPSFYVNGKFALNNGGMGENSPDKYAAAFAQAVNSLLSGKN